VHAEERRTQSMPFVGADRRTSGDTGYDDDGRLVA
jgi:hypothetical protein